MLRTSLVTTSIFDIPNPWVFEYYLNLSEKLHGQEVKINSVFSNDKTPSFTVFPREDGDYNFKDFSSGKGGNHITLVKEMFNIETHEAIRKIINDYTEYLKSGNTVDNYKRAGATVKQKFKVKWVKPRKWTTDDAKFWKKFKIGSDMLEKFNVKPLSSYMLERETPHKLLTIQGPNIYGYFRKVGSCYKIYQPFQKESKFIKISNYIQGQDQLTYTKPYLVIMASLKDMMAFNKLGFKNIEAIAPHSENTMIPKATMEKYLKKYKGVCTLFDNDQAGIKAMGKYKEKYNLSGVHLKMEGDVADCVKEHGIRNTREWVYPLLTKALTGTLKELP